jgi:hypothetical protein
MCIPNLCIIKGITRLNATVKINVAESSRESRVSLMDTGYVV